MFFTNNKLYMVIFGVAGVLLLDGRTSIADSLAPLSVNMTDSEMIHDHLWNMREKAFDDIATLNQLSMTDPVRFRKAQALLLRELQQSVPTPDVSGNPLVFAMMQAQEVVNKITNCSNAKDAPKKIKEFIQQLQKQKLDNMLLKDLLDDVAPYFIHTLGARLVVELNLQSDQKKQQACVVKFFEELRSNGLAVYGEMLMGILQQRRVGRISSELIPIMVAKSLVGHHFNQLRNIHHYENLQKQYPNKACDRSYFLHVKDLDPLMQQDPETIQAHKAQMVHALYALCTALNNAANNVS